MTHVNKKQLKYAISNFIFFYLVGYYYKGFRRLPLISRIAIITSAIAFLILLVLATAYCCKRNRATTADQVKVKPPSYDEATSTKTKVPMQPLINEV